MNDEELTGFRAALRDIAKMVENAIGGRGSGKGFALFFAPANGDPKYYSYMSNAQREDVIESLKEWLEKVKTVAIAKSSVETTEEVDERLALERQCADIGRVIADRAKMILFLFHMGEGGAMTYFTNLPDARERIQKWIESGTMELQ